MTAHASTLTGPSSICTPRRLHVLVLTDDGAVRRPAFLAEQPAEQCGFLPWVERFVADVEGGVFGVRQLTLSRPRSGGRATVPHLNLFRQRPPGVTEAVTHGVRIRAAPLCRITGPCVDRRVPCAVKRCPRRASMHRVCADMQGHVRVGVRDHDVVGRRRTLQPGAAEVAAVAHRRRWQ